jgi:hypothetical protein
MRTGLSAIAIVAVALAGCASADEVAGPDESAREVIAELTTGALGIDDALLRGVFEPEELQTSWPYPRPILYLLANWGVSLPGRLACVSDSRTARDADGDGIPAYYSAIFNCRTYYTFGKSWSLTGKMVLVDNDDKVAFSGYRLGLEDFAVREYFRIAGTPGWAKVQRLDGSIAIARAEDLHYDIEKAFILGNEVVNSAGSVIRRGWLEVDGQWFYHPDNVTSLHAGWLKGGGTTTNIVPAGPDVHLAYHTDPALHYTRECKQAFPDVPAFDKGAILFEQDGATALRLEFGACGKMEWSYSSPLPEK